MEQGNKARKTSTRSETVSVRLEPRLRYLAELAARKQRRTLSSFIEWAVEDSLRRVTLHSHDSAKSVEEEAGSLWDIEPADRFARLALRFDFLLNHEEQVIWKLIKEYGYFWKGKYVNDEWAWTVNLESLVYTRLRAEWLKIKAVAEGTANMDTLPKWDRQNPSPKHF